MANLDVSNRVIQGLWIGTHLSRMEEMSLRSFLAHGHDYHLYTYGPIDNVPQGVRVKDANEIIPSAKIFKYREFDSYAGFSNHFRYKLLLQNGGWWADTDLICLRPFDFPADYVFSSQDAQEGEDPSEVVNVGAIKSPPGSKVLEYAWRVSQSKPPDTLVWGEIGPLLLARAVQELGLGSFVRRAAEFCPIPWFRWQEIIDPGCRTRIGEGTYAVHLWNELWRRGGFDKDEDYDPACLYERLKAMYLERPAPGVFLHSSRTVTPEIANLAGAPPSSALPRISALVLTRDSEPRLARCLESIRQAAFADEIVVCVDAATIDHTLRVARSFTPHVHILPTAGYLESALQKAASFCTCDFILRIDDDESLGGNWDKESFQLLAAFNRFAQFWLPRRWLVPPGDAFIASNPWFPDLQLRLFANEPDRITWPKQVHEEMSVAGRSITLFDRWINHHTFLDRPRGERRRRCEEYRRLNPQQDFNYFYLYEDLEFRTLPTHTGAIAAVSPGGDPRRNAFSYPVGSTVDFSTEGNGVDYVGKGWGLPESWGTWTVGGRAEIHLPLGIPLGCGATLSAEVMPLLTPLHPTLQARVFYRETLIDEWSFDRSSLVTLTLNVCADLIAGDPEPSFYFQIADPRSPAETGQSTDKRLLGLGFKSLRLQRSRVTAAADRPDAVGDSETGENHPRPLLHPPGSNEAFIAQAIRIGHRVLPNIDLDVFWDGMWIFRVGDCHFPVPQVTEPQPWIWHELAVSAGRYLQQAEDNWYRIYRPKRGDVIVDIGAGRGEDTCAFSRAVGDSGRVLAIEAHPVSFAVLQKFCAWNGLSNVTTLNLACADKPGRVWITENPNGTPGYAPQGDPSASGSTVNGLPFDCIWQNSGIGCIDFMKMNIEGAERFALVGCSRALQHTRNISVAAHDHRADRGEAECLRTGDFVRDFLRDAGFHLVPRDDPRSWARGHIHGFRPKFQ